jgi:hypothetical protein
VTSWRSVRHTGRRSDYGAADDRRCRTVVRVGGSGGPHRRTGRFGRPADPSGDDWLLHVIQDHNWSWSAWDFHPQAGPTLISDWNYTPTPDFGVFVRQMLAGTLPRYTPPVVPQTK